jgi:NAD(P) transhydrogenase subunit alpha
MTLFTEITIFVLAAFVGFEVISKVPTTLHTPLMSQTNAIHGIVMLGGLIVVGYANDPLEYVIGTIAIAFGTINIVGGFMVTDRMLACSRKPKPAEEEGGRILEAVGGRCRHRAYIVAFSSSRRRRGSTRPPQAGQPDRRRWHGGRRRHHPAARRDRQLGPDRARPGDWDGDWRDRLDPRADDRDAADGRPLQRRRRRRRGADRLVGDPPRDLAGRGDPTRHADPGPLRGGGRLGLLLGVEHRLQLQAIIPTALVPGPAGPQRVVAGGISSPACIAANNAIPRRESSSRS